MALATTMHLPTQQSRSLTTNAPTGSSEIALRFHQTGEVAPASGGDGIYNFALGTTPISFDWSIVGDPGYFGDGNSLITVKNVGTGQTASYMPFIGDYDCDPAGGLLYSCQKQRAAEF
jgi:hypothetical protein